MNTLSTFTKLSTAAALVFAVGCTTDPYTGEQKTSNTAKGAGWGALAGAVVGAATASDEDREKGALTGAAAGAAIGGGYGYYQDRQEAKLREELQGTGVQVQRNGDIIRLIMPGNITFAVDSTQINSGFYRTLDSVIKVIKEFDKTNVQINGYTDSSGAESYNLKLSKDRAESVRRYFTNQGVNGARIRDQGFGEANPIASNDTAAGRAANRRVEINLVATAPGGR